MKIVLPILGLFLVVATAARAEDKQLWAKSIIDQKGPELVVEKWLTPRPDTKGKFVLVDFWATWCGPCRKAIPELNEFQKKYADKLVVIGISDESEDDVKKMQSPKIEYANAIDTKARTKDELKVEGIPHVIVMDPEGIVRWEGFPFLDGHELTGAVLEEIFSKYGKPAAKPATKP
jgi:thiol-disulfide isomerase/thioredoxin